MKKSSLIFLMALMILSSFAFVSAQPPFQEFIGQEGLQLEYQKFEYLQIGEPFEVHAHVFNISNGVFMDNTTTDCFFHGYYRNGTHAIKTEMSFEPPFDWSLSIPGTFFTGGKGSWIMQCNSTDAGGLGGFTSGQVYITRTGFELTTAEALVYSVLALGVLILFIIGFYFMISTPYSNKKNEKGAVIQITKLKYVKLGLIMLCWVLFTWFLNILIGLSDSFVYLTMYYGFFGFMFDIMNRLALPSSIIILVIAGIELVRDSNVQKDIKKFGSSYK